LATPFILNPQVIDYPVLASSPVRLNAYPVEAAIAEKFEANTAFAPASIDAANAMRRFNS
jgi:hypothetical protein